MKKYQTWVDVSASYLETFEANSREEAIQIAMDMARLEVRRNYGVHYEVVEVNEV